MKEPMGPSPARQRNAPQTQHKTSKCESATAEHFSTLFTPAAAARGSDPEKLSIVPTPRPNPRPPSRPPAAAQGHREATAGQGQGPAPPAAVLAGALPSPLRSVSTETTRPPSIQPTPFGGLSQSLFKFSHSHLDLSHSSARSLARSLHCPHSPSSFLLPRLLPSYLLPETLVCPPPAHFSFVSLCALLPLQQPLSLRHSLPLPTCILPVGASRHGPVGLHIYSRKVNETDPNSSGIWKGSRRAFIFQNSVTFRKTYKSRSSGRSRARSNRLRALSSAPRNPRSFGCSSQSANLQIRRPGASRIPAQPCSRAPSRHRVVVAACRLAAG